MVQHSVRAEVAGAGQDREEQGSSLSGASGPAQGDSQALMSCRNNLILTNSTPFLSF